MAGLVGLTHEKVDVKIQARHDQQFLVFHRGMGHQDESAAQQLDHGDVQQQGFQFLIHAAGIDPVVGVGKQPQGDLHHQENGGLDHILLVVVKEALVLGDAVHHDEGKLHHHHVEKREVQVPQGAVGTVGMHGGPPFLLFRLFRGHGFAVQHIQQDADEDPGDHADHGFLADGGA